MTRKRFIKLLMAHGYSRNSANVIADSVLHNDMTYTQGFIYVTRTMPVIQDIIPKMVGAFSNVMNAACSFGNGLNAVKQATKAFSDIFQASMGRT